MIATRRTQRGAAYDVRLRDADGKMYTRTFSTKREAITWEASQRADRARGVWLDPRFDRVTLDALAADWLEANPAKRASTYTRDEIALRRHILPALGDKQVRRLTPDLVQRTVNGWTDQMAPRSVRRTYGVLRAVLNLAVDRDLLARTPCRGIRLPATQHESRRVVNGEEVAALSRAAGDHGPMVLLGVVLGLRWGEVAGLRVGRLDFLRGTLAVAEQVTRGHGGAPVAGPPKSEAGRRTLAVPAPLMGILSDHLAARDLTGADPDAYVFATAAGGPLHYSNWRRRVWVPATETAGLPGLTFHDLRRANATALVADGVDLKTAQTRLGHSDPRLTLAVYAQATAEGDRLAADRLGARFLGPADRLATGA